MADVLANRVMAQMPAHILDTPAVRADMLRESARRAIARAEPHHRPPATQHAAQGKEASAESCTQREHEEALRALNHTFESRDERKAKILSLEGGGMASSFVDLLGSTSPGIKVRPEPDAIHRHAAAESGTRAELRHQRGKGSMPSAFGVAIGPRPAMAADAATASGAPLEGP